LRNYNLFKEKLAFSIKQSEIHLKRIDEAFEFLKEYYKFPISEKEFEEILINKTHLAFADQIIYRFSKAQDTIGAKVIKSFLLYEGEDINKPFLDLLDRFEKLQILNIEDWYAFREIRNEIAHEYEDNSNKAVVILNSIYKSKEKLKNIIKKIKEISGL
jgi:uncharacterized protein with HEPN domain